MPAAAISRLLARIWRIEPHRFWPHKSALVGLVANGAGRVLDVGCGPGLYRASCGSGDYVGLDLCGRPDVIGSASALPFRDSAFDAVIAMDVLEHVEDIDAASSECHRVLRAGGRLLVVTPNSLGLGAFDSLADPTHRHHLTWKAATDLLTRAGFREISSVTLHLHVFPPLNRRLRRLTFLQQSVCLIATKTG